MSTSICVQMFINMLMFLCSSVRFSAWWCMNETSLVTALCVCLWPCLWVGAHVSIGIFSTTSHCNAMALICTPLSPLLPPPPPCHPPHPPHPPTLSSAPSNPPQHSLSLEGASNSLPESFAKREGVWDPGVETGSPSDLGYHGDKVLMQGIQKLLQYVRWVLFLPWALANLNINLK